MSPDRVIAEIVHEVESDYIPQPRNRINPKLTARFSAKLTRRRQRSSEETDVAKKFIERIQTF